MEKIYDCILKLMRCSLGTGNENIEDIKIHDWELLYSTLLQLRVDTILFPIVEKIAKSCDYDAEVLKHWSNRVRQVSLGQMFSLMSINSFLNEFKKAEIPVIILKGLAISRFYEKPELRAFNDLDILVESRFMLQAQRKIEEMGYVLDRTEEDDHGLHYSYKKEGAVYLELHYELVHSGLIGKRNTEKYYSHIWNNYGQASCFGVSFKAMAVEDELVNQIIHLATHLVYYGVSMKALYDIALIIKTSGSKLDLDYITMILEDINLYKFGQLIFSLCKTFFLVDIDGDLKDASTVEVRNFMDDFMNYYAVQTFYYELNGWCKIISEFKFLCRHVAFFPFICLVEIMSQLNMHKFSLKIVKSNSLKNIKLHSKKIKLLKKMELIL
ncbi:MAG TPA: nucleotidyltransferase family protein [Clostridia bacterium]